MTNPCPGNLDATHATATWATTYDLLGRPVTQVDPDSGTTTMTYFDTGDIATSTDGAGRVLAYDYDLLGRKIGKYQSSLTGTKLAGWTYDTASNGVGQAASSISYSGGFSYTETSAGYDGNGNSLGSTLTSTDPALSLMPSYATARTSTSTNLPATQTLASSSPSAGVGTNAETLTDWYDNHGDPTALTGNFSYVSGAVYTPYGELSQLTLGTSSSTAQLTYTRDLQTRRVTDVNFSGQTAYPQLEDLSYAYDLSGNPTKTTDVQGPSGAPTETQCYTYNGIDQLTQAWSATDNCTVNPTTAASNATVGGPQPYWTTWAYNYAGDRTGQTKHAATGGITADTSTSYTRGNASHVHALMSTGTTGGSTSTASYSYNGDGAEATSTITGAQSTFAYGPDGQLTNVAAPSGNSKYVRDADGNILTRTDPAGNTTLYLPGQEIQVSANKTTVTVNHYYTIGGITVAMKVGIHNPIYLMSDLHGSAQVAVDSGTWAITRRYLDPFGNQLGASGGAFPGTHGFLGKPNNPTTQLTDLGAREYDPATGRFTSVDPILTGDPQSANGYAYANNNPLTNTDPSGLTYMTPDAPGDCKGGHCGTCGGGGPICTTPVEQDFFFHKGYYPWDQKNYVCSHGPKNCGIVTGGVPTGEPVFNQAGMVAVIFSPILVPIAAVATASCVAELVACGTAIAEASVPGAEGIGMGGGSVGVGLGIADRLMMRGAANAAPRTLSELVADAHSSIGGTSNLKSFAQAAWGGGGPNAAATARSLIGVRTASQLFDEGITLRNATAWRDVYQAAVNAGRGTASEGTAQARLDLMNSYLDLLGGGR